MIKAIYILCHGILLKYLHFGLERETVSLNVKQKSDTSLDFNFFDTCRLGRASKWQKYLKYHMTFELKSKRLSTWQTLIRPEKSNDC